MSKQKFKAIQSFLKVCNPNMENDEEDKLSKVILIHNYIRQKCMKLYQPYVNISIDERMVRNRGRFTFRQFIKDKPTRWGMKLWVLADASNGYTYNFEVYVGKGTPVSKQGLAYDVDAALQKQKHGYHVYFDNFYTGDQLLKDLLTKKTVITKRKGVPQQFKDTKTFAKGPRCFMRWKRELSSISQVAGQQACDICFKHPQELMQKKIIKKIPFKVKVWNLLCINSHDL